MSVWSADEVSTCRDSWRRSSCSVWRPLRVTARCCKQINERRWMEELNLSCCNQRLFHQRRVTTLLVLLNHWIILILDVCERLFVQSPTVFGRAHLPAPSQVWFRPWADDSGQEHVFSRLHVIHCADSEMLSTDAHLAFWLLFYTSKLAVLFFFCDSETNDRSEEPDTICKQFLISQRVPCHCHKSTIVCGFPAN